MSQQSNQYRKVFIDSRWRTSGTHGDFTIELPRDLATSRTASVHVASCSFSNTFSTIESGVNDEFYFLAEDPQAMPPITDDARWLYGLYQRDQLARVAAGAEFLYLLRRLRSPADGSWLYHYTMATLVLGAYEMLKTGKSGLSQTNIEDMHHAVGILKYMKRLRSLRPLQKR
jgi:hypothetical protein